MFGLCAITVWIICIATATSISHSKGYGYVPGIIAGLLGGPFGVLYCAMYPTIVQPTSNRPTTLRARDGDQIFKHID